MNKKLDNEDVNQNGTYFVAVFVLIILFGMPYSFAESDESFHYQPLEKQIRSSSIYAEDGTELLVLYVGQQAYVSFSTLDIKNPEGVQIKIGYQVVTDRSYPIYDDVAAEFTSDSINISRPLSLPYVPDKSGTIFLRLNMSYDDSFNNTSGNMSGSQNSLQVVEEYSKAINNSNGMCKMHGFLVYAKSDYSTAVCVSYDTWVKLKERGY